MIEYNLKNMVKRNSCWQGFYRIKENSGYRKCLQFHELLEIGRQIFRSRVTHVIGG